MTDNPESQKDYQAIQEASQRRFPRPTNLGPGSQEQIRRAVERREEYFRGKIRVSTPPKTLRMPSGKEVTLPRTPPNWTEMRRVQENFLTGQPEHMSRSDELTEGERYYWDRFAGVAGAEVAQKTAETFEALGEVPVIGPIGQWLGKGLINALSYASLETQRALGYQIQANLDPDLRSKEAISIILKSMFSNKYDDPEGRAALSPVQQKALAARDVSNYFYQTHAPAGGGIIEDSVQVAFGLMPSLEKPEDVPEDAPWWKKVRITHPFFRVVKEKIENGTFFGGDKVGPYERAWLDKYIATPDGEFLTSDYMEALFERAQEMWRGEWVGATGGLPEMLRMREQIINGADLETAYAGYVERQGALIFRSQVHEAAMTIVLDPINYILPYLRPIERLHAARQIMLFNRVAPEITQAAGELRKAVSLLDEVDDFGKFADDLVRIGKHMTVAGADEVVDSVVALAKNGVDDVAQYERALAPLDDILTKLDDLKEMPRAGRVIVALTGGDPLNPNYGGKIGKAWRSSLNPITLSASSRVNEYMDTVYNNLDVLLRMARGVEGPRGMVALFKKAASGAFGKTFGHMFVSPVGRHVQALYKSVSGKVDDLLRSFKIAQPYVRRAGEFGRLIGEDTVTVVTRLGRGSEEAQSIFTRAVEVLDDLARAGDLTESQRVLRDLIRAGEFKVENLVEIGAMLKSTSDKVVPYTDELFRAAMMNEVVDAAVELGQLQFGVKEMKWFEKGANYIKQAESLLLLGANPIYPVQNFFNNEVTAVARGVYGLILPDAITRRIPGVRRVVQTVEGYFESHGMSPARLYEGFGIAGPEIIEDAAFAAGKAEREALVRGRTVLRRTIWGKQGRITQAVMDKMRSIKGTRQLAAQMERWARERSIMVGHMKAWNRLWRPGRGFSKLDDFLPSFSARLSEHDSELPNIIQDLAASARKPDDFDALMALDDLQLNPETIFRRTAEELGLQVEDIPEIASFDVKESVRLILGDLPARPSTDQIQSAFDEIRDIVQVNLDEAFEAHIPTMLEEAIARVETNGPNGVLNLYGEIADTLYQRHTGHMMRLDQKVSEIVQIEDSFLRNRAWKALLEESDVAWNRYWEIEKTIRKAITRGMRKRGSRVPNAFMESFTTLRDESQSFIKKRNKLWNDLFDSLTAGKLDDPLDYQLGVAEIYEELDNDYMRLIDLTENAHARMDSVFLGALVEPSDELGSAAYEWRRLVRALRRQDMENVLEFRRSIRGLPKDMKHEAWRAFHQSRMEDMGRITRMEQYGRLMLDGDQNAAQFFINNARARMDGIRERMADVVEAADEFGVTLSDNQMRLLDSIEQGNDAFKVEVVSEFIDQEFTYARIRWGERTAEGRIPVELTREALELPEERLQELLYFEMGQVFAEVRTPDGQLQYGDELRQLFDIPAAEQPLDLGLEIHDELSEAVARFFIDPDSLQEANPELYRFIETAIDENEDIRRALYAVRDAIPETVPTEGDIPVLPDFDALVGRQMYVGMPADELWFEKGGAILDEMENQALQMLERPALRLERLPEDLQRDVRNYFDHVTGQMNDTKLASVRIAEGMSDAALLNYNRRYNIDNWLNIAMPFHFWWTHSAMRWALHSLDRPAMLTSFIKMRKFLNNVIGEHKGFPSRLRGHVKIDVPFAPEEFGEIWVNPLRSFGLPFEQFIQPFEWAAQSQVSMDRRVDRILRDMVESGQITEEQRKQAAQDPRNPLYQRARSMALANDQSLRFDLMDFMNLSVSPHIPISMAWNIARGTPEQIAPLPHTRALRHVGTLLGVKPGVYDNLWGNVREHFGLEAWDEYDVYRTERELSNMAGANLITADEAISGMITHEGELWERARERSAKVEAGRWGARLLGIPINPYPEGEEHLRETYDQWYKALDLKDRGDTTAVRDFFEMYPEFEARLALFDSPEEKVKQFLSDQIWDTWNGLDDLNKREVKEQLGPQFEEMFLNPNTRSLDAISPEVLAMWSRMVGGEDPGNLAPNALPIPLTDPMIARRMQSFYDYRRRHFPQYYELQKEYFDLEKGQARREYLAQNPQLKLYWDWRRDFMYRNPDLAPYIEDDPEKLPNYESYEVLREISAQQPSYTWGEWTRLVTDQGGYSLMNLVTDYVRYGESLPSAAQRQLNDLGQVLGVGGWQEVLSRMEGSIEMEELVPSGLTEPHYAP